MVERILVMDVGGTHVSSAVVDMVARDLVAGTLYDVRVDADGSADSVLSAWADALDEARTASGQSVHALGIAMPSPFDAQNGISLMQHKYAGLYGVNVRTALQKNLGLNIPVTFVNDAAAFALGEGWLGGAAGHDRAICITLGTGFGAAFLENGTTRQGGPGVTENGELWDAPFRGGIAEDAISRQWIRTRYSELGGDPEADVAQIALACTPESQQVFDEFGDTLGEFLYPWLRDFNASALVIGGNIARSWSLFSPALTARLAPLAGLHITRALLPPGTANLIGAAYFAWRQIDE